jgi:hypothetical protein
MASRPRRFTPGEREVIAAGPECQWKDHATWKSARLTSHVISTDPVGDEYVPAVNLTPSRTMAAGRGMRIYPGKIRGGR